MNRFKTWMAGILMVFAGLGLVGCTPKEHPEMAIAGSTTILPLMNRISALYEAENTVEIRTSAGGSLTGIKTLIAGKCDLAMCSSPIGAPLRADAQANGVTLKEISFAYDMIVPIVHPSNPIQNLSLEQLGEIYAETVESWAAVGGRPAKIEVVTRGPSSGTRRVWGQRVLKADDLKKGCILQDSNSGVLAYVAEHPHAIGYVSFAILNHEVKALSVNQVAPSIRNAKHRKYPIVRPLYLYVNENTLSYDVKSLIVFVLSVKGQRIVERSGFIPRDALKQKAASKPYMTKS
ncbi:MAG: PstS family phosphate ABC transporter substrate-binding protein [Desulfobacteraceae bacterium]